MLITNGTICLTFFAKILTDCCCDRLALLLFDCMTVMHDMILCHSMLNTYSAYLLMTLLCKQMFCALFCRLITTEQDFVRLASMLSWLQFTFVPSWPSAVSLDTVCREARATCQGSCWQIDVASNY